MDLNLNGRVGLIVGATRGIGAATARVLHAEGMKLALVSRTASELEKVSGEIAKDGGTVRTWAADMGDPS